MLPTNRLHLHCVDAVPRLARGDDDALQFPFGEDDVVDRQRQGEHASQQYVPAVPESYGNGVFGCWRRNQPTWPC